MLHRGRIRGFIFGLAILLLLLTLAPSGALPTAVALGHSVRPPGTQYLHPLRHTEPILGHDLPAALRHKLLDRPKGSGPVPDKQLTGNAISSQELDVNTASLPKVTRLVFVSNGLDEWINADEPLPGQTVDPKDPNKVPDGLIDPYGLSPNGFNVWMMRYDGTQQIQITNLSGDEREPAFDPGATVIAFANDQTGTYQIYTVDIITKTVRQITFDAGNKRHPTWSPDGTQLAYATDIAGNSNHDIYVVKVRGGSAPVSLANTPADETQPTWSPDGLLILYTRADGSVTHIWSMDPTGANQTQLTNGGGQATASDRDPAWRQDGTGSQFAFASNRLTDLTLDATANYNIWSVGRTGETGSGPAAQLHTNTNVKAKTNSTQPAYSPRLDPVPPVGPSKAPTLILFVSNRADAAASAADAAQASKEEPDIWAFLLVDDRPPVLLELPTVSNRNPAPNSPVTIYAKPYDDETGVKSVFAFFKDPDSAGDDSQGIEHKHFLTFGVNFEPRSFPGTYFEEIGYDQVGGIQLFDDGDLTNHGDKVKGDGIFSGIWTTLKPVSDYLIDLVLTDNSNNVIRFDDIYGLSTVTFAPKTNVLLVDDYMEGQSFLSAEEMGRYNDSPFQFGCESYYTTNMSAANGVTNIAFNTFRGGIDGANGGGVTKSGIGTDGEDYDLWRVICRGAPDLQTLTYYGPSAESQLTPDLKSLRQVPVANRAMFWAAPHTGDVWAAAGTITDAATQALLSQFVARGGRLAVTGQDIGWALTLDGQVNNPFLANVLGAQYVRDDNSGIDYFPNTTFDVGGLAGDLLAEDPWAPNTHYGDGLTTENDGWTDTRDNTLTAMNHVPGNPDNTPDAFSFAPYPDVVHPAGAQQIYGFGGSGAADGGAVKRIDTATGARVAYFAFPFEALDRHYHHAGTPTAIDHCRNKRSKLAHVTLCWLRTGGVQGRVLAAVGLQPITKPAPIVTVHQLGNPNTVLFAQRCLKDGTFVMNGLPPGIYELQAKRPGFKIDKPNFQWVHGGLSSRVRDFVISQSEPGGIQGTVTSLATGDPVANVTITAVSTDPTAPAIPSVTTGPDGTYVIPNVPAGDYNVTADGSTATPPYGTDTKKVTVIPGSSVTQDFKLPAAPGTLVVKVLDKKTSALLGGATVTVTLNKQTVTSGTTAASGGNKGKVTFSIPPGAYDLLVDDPGYQSATAAATVLSAKTVTVVVKLTALPPGSIAGQVFRASNPDEAFGGVGIDVIVGGVVVKHTVTASTYTFPTGGGSRYNYLIADVPAGGGIVVRATVSGRTVTPDSRTISVATGVVTYGVDFAISALHTFPPGLQFVSVPFDYSDALPPTILGTPAGQTLQMAAWDPALGKYATYPKAPADRLRLGVGYWLDLAQSQDLVRDGSRAGDPFFVPLAMGWNAIGDPFTLSVDFFSLRVRDSVGVVRTIEDAISLGQVRNGLFAFGAGGYRMSTSIAPYSGYWVFAGQNVSLVVSDPATTASVVTVERPALTQPANGWLAPVVVSAAGMTDAATAFGVAADTAAASVPKPPAPQGPFIYAFFSRSGEAPLAIDARKAGTRKWTLTVRCTAAKAPVTVSWPDLSVLPQSARPVLRDAATGRQVYMRTTRSYTYRPQEGGERQLEIEVSDQPQGALTVTAAAAQPQGRGATVNYALSRDAQVTVQVRNIAGRLVAEVASREPMTAGANVASWNGRTTEGVTAPAGSYLVRITARSGDGQEASALAVVSVGG